MLFPFMPLTILMTKTSSPIFGWVFIRPIKPVITKLFVICETVFPIKEYENFTVKNYQYNETLVREQH